jgi:FtsZ-interacting cell division protein YlmF
MGFFNWLMGGVNVEKRETKARPGAEFSLEIPDQPEAETPADAVEATTEATNTSTILFDNLGGTGMQSTQFAASQYSNNFQSALGGTTYGNRNILIVTPRTNADVSGVVENLQRGDACIICLDGIEPTDAQRRLDFLSGVICAMNGSIKPLNHNTYILTPSGIGVRN